MKIADKVLNIHADKKDSSLADLAEMKTAECSKKFPGVPAFAVPKYKYEDKTANGLTRCIIDFIRVTGGQAERIANMGRQMGTGRNHKWIPGSGMNGTADISATKLIALGGRKVEIKVAIEVKVGKDRQSEAQRHYQHQIEQAAGIYLIATSFEQFIEAWNKI